MGGPRSLTGRGILLEFGFEDVKGNSDWVARQASLPLPCPWGPGVLFWATFTWPKHEWSNLEWNWVDFKPILHFLHSHPIFRISGKPHLHL